MVVTTLISLYFFMLLLLAIDHFVTLGCSLSLMETDKLYIRLHFLCVSDYFFSVQVSVTAGSIGNFSPHLSLSFTAEISRECLT